MAVILPCGLPGTLWSWGLTAISNGCTCSHHILIPPYSKRIFPLRKGKMSTRGTVQMDSLLPPAWSKKWKDAKIGSLCLGEWPWVRLVLLFQLPEEFPLLFKTQSRRLSIKLYLLTPYSQPQGCCSSLCIHRSWSSPILVN